MKTNWTKLRRDGKVAVLYSPGFGAGWRSWANDDERDGLTFDSELVEALERGELTVEKVESLGYTESYLGGLEDLAIAWLPEDAAFQINEYDGAESIELRDGDQWIRA